MNKYRFLLGNIPKDSGMVPVNLFLSKCKASRFGSVERELGIDPERLLNERSK